MIILNNTMKKTAFLFIIIATIIGLSEMYLSNGYSNIPSDNTETPGIINIFRLIKGVLYSSIESVEFLGKQVWETTPKDGDTFDFIVIGAGTAGATVAGRLSRNPKLKVLLIEDGTYENLYMDIPLVPGLLQMTKINRYYVPKPGNKYCQGMVGNTCVCSTAKVLGGGSVINFMAATRGNAKDYDRWAEMGNEGWAYKDVLKYFKKLETMEIPELIPDTKYHGTKGPVHITQPKFRTGVAEEFIKAAKEKGYPLVDYNGKEEIGFSYVQTTIMNSTRMSSNRAHLFSVHDRKNFHVTLESTVTKLLIDSSTKQTTGVEFVKNNKTIRVSANKEVILCAGAFGSPQLLMLSGIGPKKHLTELGINVIQDAPVGENLMDHVAFFGSSWVINASSMSLETTNLLNPMNPHMADYLLKRKGPFTIPGGLEIIGYVDTKHPEKRDGLPDVELMFGGGTFKDEFAFPLMLGFKQYLREEWHKYIGTQGWSLATVLMKPKSRGRLTLLANDINVKPEIMLNYFDDPSDIKTMIAGIKTAISFGQTKTMQALNSQLINIPYAECKYEYDSDAYWECALRTIGTTIFHYSGTCKMGKKGDPTAVVDPKLKVYGIKGLRVVDASIMPEIISGHINIPVYMIAEKAVDMIKEEWGYFKKSEL
ncbi:PREDICTED: glucose dehydrogenase [FAD, quinone]-like [Cyphomyrmex costatus]|uniref:glucose dehydrogenase [FAD, quinone]-like n=1 Tax=Cyphomyrmex costatus TaxID=456900 RepID=UPI0008523D83|nr:PREDICTED: glucose dehydrogenase [FAD, quinone]-like [Cyphomyrmex costatus]